MTAHLVISKHGQLGSLGADDHLQYALLAGRSGGQTLIGGDATGEDLTLQDNAVDGNQVKVNQTGLSPDATAAKDLGDAALYWRTLFLSNDGGNIVQCEDAVLTKTVYYMHAGGGGSGGGGDLVVKFNPIALGTNSENSYIIDFGPVDFANAEHHYIFRSTGNGGFIGDISVSTVFGGALGNRNIGFTFESDGTFQYYNNIDCRMGTPLSAGYDPLAGNNSWKRFELQMDGDTQYRMNGGASAWHRFDMAPNYLSPSSANYAMMLIDSLTDRLSANRTSRAALRLEAPTPDLNGHTLTYATKLQLLGNPNVSGAKNSAIFLGNSASLVLSNVNTGVGPTVQGITNFGGVDMLWLQAGSTDAQLMQLMLPNGASERSTIRLYNYSNLLAFTYAFMDLEVNGDAANILLREVSAVKPITEMNIGGDATSGLTDLNLRFANNVRYKFQTALLTLGDALDIALGTGTGTKLGTSALQKFGAYGVTPIVQPGATGATGHAAVGGATVQVNDTFTGGVGATAYTLGDIVAALKNLGWIAA